MSLSLVVGNRSSRVVLGEFCAGAARTDKREKAKAKQTIRERIGWCLETKPESWFLNQLNARTEFYDAVALAGTKSEPSSQRNFWCSSRCKRTRLMQA